MANGGDARIGRYQLVKRLAVGGMADIWLAQESGRRGYERTVVVKTIRGDLAEDDDLIPMLVEEARIARCLRHESIVELHEVGQDADTHYLAMEFVFGRDLRQIRERCLDRGEPFPHKHAVAIVADVLDALYYAHHVATYEGRPLRVIHRDVSPQNVIVGFDGGVKLLDFGIAKAAAQLSRTRAGVLKGKYAYMSPEQVDFRDLDHRADVFSVGVVLWEMLTGQRLFYRISEYETVRAVVACHVPFARFVDASIPWTLSMITHRALRRSPRWRYRDARDMSRALRAWDGREPAQARDDLAQWLGSLFGDELRVREQALARARRDPTRHRQIQDAGFELVDEASLEAVRPRRASSAISELPERARSLTPSDAPTAPHHGLADALTRGSRFYALLGAFVFLGVALGLYWSRFHSGTDDYAYLSVIADSSDVQVIIGNRALGRAPVADVAVLPGRHRIVGILGDERETIEIVVPPGRRETVRLSLAPARARPR